nr:hypothetical protein [Brevibacillus laterosporus]
MKKQDMFDLDVQVKEVKLVQPDSWLSELYCTQLSCSNCSCLPWNCIQ